MLLPLGGEVQLLSCPGKGKKKTLKRLKLNLENHHSIKFMHKQTILCSGDVFFQCSTNQELIDLPEMFYGCATKAREIPL